MQDVIAEQYLSHFKNPYDRLSINKEDFTAEAKSLEYKNFYTLVQIEELHSPTHESELNLDTVFLDKNTKLKMRVSKDTPKQLKVAKKITIRKKTLSRYPKSGTYIKGIHKNTRIFLEDQTKKGNKKNHNEKSTRHRDVSYGMLRQYKKRVNKVKKKIVFNILRNKSINLLFYSIQNYFYTKNSLLTLIKFEQHTSRLFLNLRSLIYYMSNLYKGLIFFKLTPTILFAT
jgi:hypothetical protein